jgi:N-acetylmuramoyl-L-alanine amidase
VLALLILQCFNRRMNRVSPLVASAFTLVFSGGVACAADLQDLRVVDDGSGTQAVLNIQGASDYKLFTLQNPDRLVVDLSKTSLSSGFRLPAANGAVLGVRTGKPSPDTLRIVFDLGGVVTTKSHIERDGASNKLVVDISPLRSGATMAKAEPLPEPTLQAKVEQAPEQPRQADLMSVVPTVAATVAAASTPSAPVAPVEAPKFTVATVPATPVATSPVVTTPAKPPAKTIQDVIGSGQRKLVVAIDAGHGGKDPGAHGPSGVNEKVVTLAVARELARLINADPGMRAVLIRDNDTFVPLTQRYMRARSAQADLFISIHADASPNKGANGASVYVLSTRGATSQAARWLADQENAADLVGGVSLDEKDHNLAAVLLDLSQSATMRASDDIASEVLGSLKNVGKAHKPSIERANFVVLRSPDVPSMLIETGFITNREEEKRLNDPGYRSRLAIAIAGGVRKYFMDQPPAGSWYASLRGDVAPSGESLGGPMLVSSPE